MRRIAFAALIVAGTGLVAGSAVTFGQEKATGIVAYRQTIMKANGDHMAAIKTVLSEVPELSTHLGYHARAIAGAAHDTPSLFPAGSDKGPTGALPAIWEKPDEFKAAGVRAEELAQKLVEATDGGDPKATLAAFGALGKEGCGGCHQTFRKKQS